MTDIWWPQDLIRPRRIDFWPEAISRSGGRTLDGSETLVTSTSVRWRATLDFAFVTGADRSRLLSWRSMQWRMLGRLRPVLIGPFDRATPAVLERRPRRVTVPYSGGETHDDGTEFVQSASTALVAAAAALRATRLVIVPTGSWVPRAGQYFSPRAGEMYGIEAIRPATIGWDVEITPPLRAPLAAGADLDFEDPTCRMRITADDGMRLPIDVSNLSEPSIELEEII